MSMVTTAIKLGDVSEIHPYFLFALTAIGSNIQGRPLIANLPYGRGLHKLIGQVCRCIRFGNVPRCLTVRFRQEDKGQQTIYDAEFHVPAAQLSIVASFEKTSAVYTVGWLSHYRKEGSRKGKCTRCNRRTNPNPPKFSSDPFRSGSQIG